MYPGERFNAISHLVGAALHHVGERLVVADLDSDLTGVAGGKPDKGGFERRIAGAENREAAILCEDLVRGLGDQVDAIAVGQAQVHQRHRDGMLLQASAGF